MWRDYSFSFCLSLSLSALPSCPPSSPNAHSLSELLTSSPHFHRLFFTQSLKASNRSALEALLSPAVLNLHLLRIYWRLFFTYKTPALFCCGLSANYLCRSCGSNGLFLFSTCFAPRAQSFTAIHKADLAVAVHTARAERGFLGCSAEINRPKQIKSADFGGPLIFPLAPLWHIQNYGLPETAIYVNWADHNEIWFTFPSGWVVFCVVILLHLKHHH